METPMRILLLEDNPADAALVEGLLREDGFACEVVCEDTREGFETSLHEGPYDLILSDYSLPAFDGLAALQMAKLYYPRVPFIHVESL